MRRINEKLHTCVCEISIIPQVQSMSDIYEYFTKHKFNFSFIILREQESFPFNNYINSILTYSRRNLGLLVLSWLSLFEEQHFLCLRTEEGLS